MTEPIHIRQCYREEFEQLGAFELQKRIDLAFLMRKSACMAGLGSMNEREAKRGLIGHNN
jgi:hypothetical protein